MVLEKTLESPLDCKEIQPVHPKGDHSWVSIARTDAEAETPVLWPPDNLGSISGLGRSPGEEKGYPLQGSGLENSMDCMESESDTMSHFHFCQFSNVVNCSLKTCFS